MQYYTFIKFCNIIRLINIFGSTGSIGIQTLDLVRTFPDIFKINILCAGNNYELLAEQINEFQPRAILIKNQYLNSLTKLLPDSKNIYSMSDLEYVLSTYPDFDLSIMAINGFQALSYSITIVNYSKNRTIAMANKEAIICGGKIFLDYIKNNSTLLLPVDSEHNSIFQLLNDPQNLIQFNEIEKITITASGGPFLNYSLEQLESVKPFDAIQHPCWRMGAKISIDSATLMNKALELIEAHYLFNLPVDAIIHPQSVVHAILKKKNGEIISAISKPDMKSHISHALFYPQSSKYILEPIRNTKLTFFEIKNFYFPFIKIAQDIIRDKLHLAILFNLAGEIAVQKFIEGKISFLAIKNFVLDAMSKYSGYSIPKSIDEIVEIDRKIRSKILSEKSI